MEITQNLQDYGKIDLNNVQKVFANFMVHASCTTNVIHLCLICDFNPILGIQ